jgi:hypothetical protein
VLIIKFKWSAKLANAKGTFMCANLKDGEETCMQVPEGFEPLYVDFVMIKL